MVRGIRLIIADDDVGIIDSIKAFIGEKYHVEGYTTSKEVIRRVREEKFDILVLDYRIDEMDGRMIVEEIRRFDNDIYIIFLTGCLKDSEGLKFLETISIQNFCEKGGDFDRIIVCIESAIKSIEFFRNKKITIGERIKELRKIYNYSQDDIAKYLEIQRPMISQYESGDTIPPTMSIIKIAKLFNVTTDYLLCYEFCVEKIKK